MRLGEFKVGKAVAIVAGLEAEVGTYPDKGELRKILWFNSLGPSFFDSMGPL